jgi:hypothetical protein
MTGSSEESLSDFVSLESKEITIFGRETGESIIVRHWSKVYDERVFAGKYGSDSKRINNRAREDACFCQNVTSPEIRNGLNAFRLTL